jgi:hypothetical protein
MLHSSAQRKAHKQRAMRISMVVVDLWGIVAILDEDV